MGRGALHGANFFIAVPWDLDKRFAGTIKYG